MKIYYLNLNSRQFWKLSIDNVFPIYASDQSFNTGSELKISLDYLLNIDNPYFEQMVSQIYLTELLLNKTDSFTPVVVDDDTLFIVASIVVLLVLQSSW